MMNRHSLELKLHTLRARKARGGDVDEQIAVLERRLGIEAPKAKPKAKAKKTKG